MSAELLCVHSPDLRFAADDVEYVHSAVSDVGNKVDAGHLTLDLSDCRIALRIDLNSGYTDVIIITLKIETNLLLLYICPLVYGSQP